MVALRRLMADRPGHEPLYLLTQADRFRCFR